LHIACAFIYRSLNNALIYLNRTAGTGVLADEYPVSKITGNHITKTLCNLPVCVLLNVILVMSSFVLFELNDISFVK